MFRYAVPQGWRAIERPGMCMVVAPDMTMAVGLLSPGPVQGSANAEQYMKDALTRIAQFQNIQVMNAQRGQVQPPFTEATTFMISYTSGGQQFAGCVSVCVMQQNGSTQGMMQLALGTPAALQTNGPALVQLVTQIAPAGMGQTPSPNAGPTPGYNPGPTPNSYPNAGPTPGYNAGPTPNAYPTPDYGPTPTPTTGGGNPLGAGTNQSTPAPAPGSNAGWGWQGQGQ